MVTLKIGMIAKSTTNPVFLSAKKGAEDAAKELSAKEGASFLGAPVPSVFAGSPVPHPTTAITNNARIDPLNAFIVRESYPRTYEPIKAKHRGPP